MIWVCLRHQTVAPALFAALTAGKGLRSRKASTYNTVMVQGLGFRGLGFRVVPKPLP